ncbi:MAG: NUDIX domain-containing protein [Ilumatobacteraceae bacterium]
MAASAAHELVDIVDDDDRVIATVTRAQMRAQRLQHRAVSIAVVGTDGRLLVHRRADDKDVWPGMWDIAAGGVVAAGETYQRAAHRELAEELGVHAERFEHLGEGRFADESVALIGRGYLAVHDGPFTFTDGEIAEVRWVTAAELTELIARERFVPDNLALLLPLLVGRIRAD